MLTAARRAVWLIPALCFALVAAIYAPRFDVHSPSLVDDWFALTYAQTATHQLLTGHYNTAIVDYGGRYRPTYALLADLQWMFGSRNSTLVPTIIGLGRLLFFFASVAITVIAVLRGIANRPFLIAGASLVPTSVIATRGISYNFVRFGVDEPTAFAAIAIGLVGMTAGMRDLTGAKRRTARWRSAAVFAPSYLVYAFGAYMTEASAAVVVLLPPLYYWLSRDPVFARSRRSTILLAGAAIVILAPIAHVLFEVLPNLGRGSQGGRTVTGFLGWLLNPAVSTVVGISTTASLVWPALIAVALVSTGRGAIRRDRHAVLLLGMVVSGFAFAYLANLGTSGNSLSRYYIPLLVAAGIASVWRIASLRPAPQSLILAFMTALVLAGRGDVVAQDWLRLDQAGDAAIALASQANSTQCPVYLVDFPDERRMGLARVLQDKSRGSLVRCSESNPTAYAVKWTLATPMSSPEYPTRCKAHWQLVARDSSVDLARCSNFSPPAVIRNQDTLSGARFVHLVPPSSWIDASVLNRLAYVDP
jgi:hypothetical protein